MVPRGYWNQDKIDAFWRNEDSEEVDMESEQPIFKYNGIVLEANKYKGVNIEETLRDEKYSRLTID